MRTHRPFPEGSPRHGAGGKDDTEVFPYCPRAAGKVDDQRLPPAAGNRPGEHGMGCLLQPRQPHGLRYTGYCSVDYRQGGLGGDVPVREAGAPGGEDEVCLTFRRCI